MKRSLQLGNTSVFLQYISTGLNIGVCVMESELSNDTAILRLQLSPLENRYKVEDIELVDEQLQSVAIDDGKIIDGFIEHLNSSSVECNLYQLELLMLEQKILFNVTPSLTTHGDLRTLYLTVD